MIATDLVAEYIRHGKKTWVFYSSEEMPQQINLLVMYFHQLLHLGGRIPEPIVLLEPKELDPSRPTTSAIYNDIRQILQFFIIPPQATIRAITDRQEKNNWSEETCIISLAAHEARHCLQKARCIDGFRGEQWLRQWLVQNIPHRFCYHALVTDDLKEWGDEFLIHANNKRKRKRSRSLLNMEVDAQATEIATAALWEKVSDLMEVTRLLHG